jgi:hypothetical protein
MQNAKTNTMKKDRFFINNTGPDERNEKKSIQSILDYAMKHKNIDEVVFLIHTKTNTGYFERVLDPQMVKDLKAGKLKVSENGPRISIYTIKTIANSFSHQMAVLAFGLDSDELFILDDIYEIAAIFSHPWINEEVLRWAKTWGAQNIETNEKEKLFQLPELIIQKAFDSLTNCINLSTGIHHPSDNELCKTYLRALNKYNYALNEEETFAYLVREKNWHTEYASDVIKLISALNSGRTFKGGKKTGLQNYIKHWQKSE